MKSQYGYKDVLSASEKVNWRVEDLIGTGQTFDFSRRFMPESLACTDALTFLDEDEKRVMNQIRGHGYLALFGLVEEFILPFVLDHVRRQLDGDDYRVRVLLKFASEEAKHIHLFKCFRSEFERQFGQHCDVIGPAEAVAEAVLSHHPLAVALTILHIEWMTQAHYVESVRDNADLDVHFKSLLKHHWMEEAQHAKLDALMVEALADSLSPVEIADAVEQYLEIGSFLDAGLQQQVEFDAEAFETATGRRMDEHERTAYRTVQRRAHRWTYLGSGMRHPQFTATLADISPAGFQRVAEVAPAFC